MQQHDPNPADQILERLRGRDRQFLYWLDGLRNNDPVFTQASVLHPADRGEWQAAVYLLTGCREAWTTLGSQVLEERSIAPVVYELDQPSRGWSSGERMLLGWVAHFWDVDCPEGGFPYRFDEDHFRRWIIACHLYKHIPPNPDMSIGGPR